MIQERPDDTQTASVCKCLEGGEPLVFFNHLSGNFKISLCEQSATKKG
jgi:hypothetical protein